MPSTKISRFQQQNKRFGKIFRRGHPHTRSWVSGDAMRDILVAPASEQDKSVVVIRRFCRRKKIADRIILEE